MLFVQIVLHLLQSGRLGYSLLVGICRDLLLFKALEMCFIIKIGLEMGRQLAQKCIRQQTHHNYGEYIIHALLVLVVWVLFRPYVEDLLEGLR